MHNNYYFLKHLVKLLEKKLSEAALIDCFSQNKDELILAFITHASIPFYIKAYLKSDFSCLSFPDSFHRAKRNSVDLFKSIVSHKITGLRMFKNERSFALLFSNSEQLLFKLHGNRSNVILIDSDGNVELFKKSLKNDTNIELDKLDRELNISFENLKLNDWNIRKVIPTLDKGSEKIIVDRLGKGTEEQLSNIFSEFISELNSPEFYVTQIKKGYKLSLIKPISDHKVFTNPIETINYLFNKQIKHQALHSAKSTLISRLNNQLLKTNNYVLKAKRKLVELSESSSNKQVADVLMANLHLISSRASKIELLNFYTNKNIIIKLNPKLSAQKNAERYYRKSKNEARELSVLNQNISRKENQIDELKLKLKEVEASEDLKELKKWQLNENYSNAEQVVSYKEFNVDEFRILVGKNARHNDELTFKVAKKDDLWLHAKDVAGSHVVIKQIPGRKFPEHVIEKAAMLAAYYSKRKTDTLCPVIFTPKKHVRKSKGARAGAVMVDKEKVVLVEPSLLI